MSKVKYSGFHLRWNILWFRFAYGTQVDKFSMSTRIWNLPAKSTLITIYNVVCWTWSKQGICQWPHMVNYILTYRGAITIGENVSMSTAYCINRHCEQTGSVDSEAPQEGATESETIRWTQWTICGGLILWEYNFMVRRVVKKVYEIFGVNVSPLTILSHIEILWNNMRSVAFKRCDSL